MFTIVMTVSGLSFVMGFLSYHAARVGVKEWKKINA